MLLLVYKHLNNSLLVYLQDLLQINEHKGVSNSLRSTSSTLLKVPFVKAKTLANRLFSVQGPILWNGLPAYLKCIESIEKFKKDLKSYLFQQH